MRYREGGVLKRAGHTEASVDLTVLAGLEPVSVLCEIVDDDGSMARLPRLRQFAQDNNLKIISIADLIRYKANTSRSATILTKLSSKVTDVLPLCLVDTEGKERDWWSLLRWRLYRQCGDHLKHIASSHCSMELSTLQWSK